LNTKSRLIALGACAAIGAALAAPTLVGAAPPPGLSKNAAALSGYTISVAGTKPNSIVPTRPNGKFPLRTMNFSEVPAGATIKGVVGTSWVAQNASIDGRDANGNKSSATASSANGVPVANINGKGVALPSTIDDACTTATLQAAPYAWQPCAGATASFPLPLPKRPSLTSFGIAGGAVEDPDCNGTFEKPTAPAGHLCIYPGKEPGYYNAKEAEIVNIARNGEGNWDATAYLMTGLAGKLGFRIDIKAYNSGYAKFYASYAYTAAKGSDSAS